MRTRKTTTIEQLLTTYFEAYNELYGDEDLAWCAAEVTVTEMLLDSHAQASEPEKVAA